jgi:hypothetical protein
MFPNRSDYLSVSIYGYSDPPSIDLDDYKPETQKPYEPRLTDRPTDSPKPENKKTQD